MCLKIYFLRHGETTYSIGGGFCGDLDPELTPSGLKMAQGFADTYSSTPWTAIYASPKQRAVATAKPLCQALNIEMQLRDGLKEIAFGEWEGKTVEQVKQEYAEDYISWMTEPAWNPPPGGETSVEIASRASLVIAEIQQNYLTGNVLVVSHKATIRIMLCSLLGIDLGRYRDRINVLAASLSIVKFDTYGPLLEVLGDRYHLPLELRQREGT
ncbi:histidine phosphatase family protein [Merismopedia glauca]|uniref:Histidine phosphatase family protein n=1 Tax=Merismopedia glauca CCAP 1448/3 TaxID=1296344 RepID=A0A2T1C7L5_9CYAN|nr:histidine phosphatase family protein [Merismopedia glauca]PSB04275.1 histidine phosphatase family protein [Merismopedia glauca CCAP 1448/3]